MKSMCPLVLLGCFLALRCEPIAPAPQATLTSAPIRIVEHNRDESGAVLARLSNGMRVIVQAVHAAPVVHVRAYVGAGGLYEGPWLGCGLSHLCEHLVAEDSISGEDTPVRSPGPHAVNRMDVIGGQANAYTSATHTCYYISSVAEKVNESIDLIADQIARPHITRESFRREHGVVQRELEMGKDEPERVLYYTHQANLYLDHPAAVPVIGYPGPLSRVTYEDVLAYHRKMYVPQNVIFVVVGDIDAQQVMDRVVETMQGFAEGRQPVFTLPEVPRVSGVRRSICPSKLFRETAELISFQTIPLLDPDLYPLDVLSTILTRGQASRLVKTLQFEKRLVTAVDSFSDTPSWGKGALTISFRARPDQADAAEQALLDELRKVARDGVTPEELARAQRQMLADYVRRQQTMEDIAATLGSDLLVSGDPAFSKHYTDRIQQVAPEEVRAVARKYFRFSDYVVTRFVPPGAAPTVLPKATPNDAVRASVYTLPNGLKVVLRPSQEVGLVSMVLAAKGGLLHETPATNGIGSLMMALSTRGAGDRSAEQIAAFFNHAGGSIGGLCGDNTYLWQASVLAEEFPEALEIFADVVLKPTFPETELANLRPLAEAAIRREEEHWSSQLVKFFREKFFTGSPWRMLPSGKMNVVHAASREQILAYHEQILRAGSSVLAVYGQFDLESTRAKLAKRFGAMPAGKAMLTIPPPRVIPATGETHVKKTATQQAGIIVASPAPVMENLDDRLPLILADTILSGYGLPNGWLHTELRGKKLVYVVHAYQKTGLAPGAFVVYAGTQPEKAPQVVEIIRKNLRRLTEYLPTRAELDRAIHSIVTAEILDNQTLSDLAMSAALNELYGLGVNWPRTLKAKLQAITPEQVRAVARKYLSGGLVVTVITPQPEQFEAPR